jgi:hypothetical protein
MVLFGSLQGHIGGLTYQWLVNWQQGERQRKLLWSTFPSSPLVHSGGPLPSAAGPKAPLQRFGGFAQVQLVYSLSSMARYMAKKELTTALVDGSDRGSTRHCCHPWRP